MDWATAAGSLRRGEDMVGSIEIVAATRNPSDAVNLLQRRSDSSLCQYDGRRRVSMSADGIEVRVSFPPPATAGATLIVLTGSAAHIDALQARAASIECRLTEDGLLADTGALHASAHEHDIYRALGLPFIPPELREGDEEVSAALRGDLPNLVGRAEIRGDLHMHSTWSDGRDSIEAMVLAGRALGYEYVAITDHSPHSAASRNLTADGVEAQAEEIAQVREAYPDIMILHGCEADILRDGRLDFADEILERFDIVLASLHDDAGHSRGRLMERYASAMRHPLVTLITHPTNRLVPYRSGYDLDYERVFEMAVETRTVLEIDGAPSHLDLDSALARQAVAAGVTVAIDSDCHRADMLDRQMNLGVLIARRGWVEAGHVLNTRSWDDVRRVVAAKRR